MYLSKYQKKETKYMYIGYSEKYARSRWPSVDTQICTYTMYAYKHVFGYVTRAFFFAGEKRFLITHGGFSARAKFTIKSNPECNQTAV